MKIGIKAPIFLMGLLQLTACGGYYALTCYNNSGIDIAVLVGGTRYQCRAGHAFRLTSNPSPGDIDYRRIEWEKSSMGEGLVPVLLLDFGSSVKKYKVEMPNIPADYAERRRGDYELFFQLEQDGYLYVVKARPAFPVDPLPPQPSGLPIHPSARP